MGRSDYLPERGHATHAWRIGLGLARGLPCKANSNHPSRFSKDARSAWSRLLPFSFAQRSRLAVGFFFLDQGVGLSLSWMGGRMCIDMSSSMSSEAHRIRGLVTQ